MASSAARLAAAQPDVWDSGKQSTDESIGIAYGGPKLESRRRYFWTVRVWDAAGQPAEPAQPAWWEMGLLEKQDWSAKWIHGFDPDEPADRAAGIRWIWIAGQDAFQPPKESSGEFRLVFDLPRKPKSAVLWLTSQAAYQASVNGHALPATRGWQEFEVFDVGGLLATGKNSIVVTAAGGSKVAGLAGLLKIASADGSMERIPTSARWEARPPEGYWKPAADVAELSDKRMGDRWPAQPALLLRGAFTTARPVQSARAYVTSLGSYQLFLNGKRVGNDILTPDWTDYRKRILYQTYDVTSLIARGQNVAGAILGDGWYGSGLGWTLQRFNFGPPPPRLMVQLELQFANGQRQTFVSDESWKWSRSPILRSELYAGETYDARLEQKGWSAAGFRDASWRKAATSNAPAAIVSSQMSPAIQVTESLKPKSITSRDNGDSVVDMGQNMVGWVTLKASGQAGATVRLRFAETLKQDGGVYVDNLRSAEATDSYTLRGGGEEIFEPHFTYHGFRYVEVHGYPGKLDPGAIAGQVFHTANEFSGKFASSNEMVNQIWRNTLWGQRGNLLSVPTDCPQRDERMGWMGDAQVFWRAASYNMDMAAFTHKWMRDVVEAQSAEGGFSDVSPRVIDESDGAPAWGDAGVIIPWTAW
ncbi:MAG: family 78 glycoside hydrolase catalytic domain, partial [Fimbriimonas ginsengisoli]|nr:family 78 glycoside hydrolase catalytic domain [Fimbriimonas ginsengisoli]